MNVKSTLRGRFSCASKTLIPANDSNGDYFSQNSHHSGHFGVKMTQTVTKNQKSVTISVIRRNSCTPCTHKKGPPLQSFTKKLTSRRPSKKSPASFPERVSLSVFLSSLFLSFLFEIHGFVGLLHRFGDAVPVLYFARTDAR